MSHSWCKLIDLNNMIATLIQFLTQSYLHVFYLIVIIYNIFHPFSTRNKQIRLCGSPKRISLQLSKYKLNWKFLKTSVYSYLIVNIAQLNKMWWSKIWELCLAKYVDIQWQVVTLKVTVPIKWKVTSAARKSGWHAYAYASTRKRECGQTHMQSDVRRKLNKSTHLRVARVYMCIYQLDA